MSATQPLPTPSSAPPGPAAAERRRGRFLLQAAFLLVGGVLLLELAIVAGLVGYTFLMLGAEDGDDPVRAQPIERRTMTVDVAPDPDAGLPAINVWDRHGPINVLLLGLDHDSCEDPNAQYHRSDTMILVRFDPVSEKAAVMSLPRDLYVHITGYGGKKLTVAHLLGDMYDYSPGQGPGLAMQVVRENFDLPVHRFVRIDFAGFERIVDTIGPITVDVPASREDPTVGLRDTQYPTEDCGYMTVDFPPGPNELDGERALQYVRSRKSTSDFDRSRRQVQVLAAIRQKLARPGILLDLPKLVPALLETVDTDLSAPEILSLAKSAVGVDLDEIISIPIDENLVYDDVVVIDDYPQSVLQRDPFKWNEARQRFLNIEALPAPTDTPAAATPSP